GTVTRIAGANRYLTAVELSQSAFGPDNVDAVYLATGGNFPDALAAGAPAALTGTPILLTTQVALPEVTRDEILRLQPEFVFLLGGPGAVSEGVEAEVDALVP